MESSIVTKIEFDSFIADLNNLNTARIEIDECRKRRKSKSNCYTILSIFAIVFSLGLFIACPFVFGSVFFAFIIVASIFFIMFWSFICLASTKPGPHHEVHEITRCYLAHRSPYESIIKKWNDEYFIHNRVYVTYPKNLSYIQFNVDPDWRLETEHHIYPMQVKIISHQYGGI